MTIYVLDDDILETELWRETVRQNRPDWKCFVFSDPDEFKEAVSYQQPDVAVLDMVMPFITGPDVCKWIHEKFPAVQVMFCTGLEGAEYRVLSESCRAKYVCKSVPHKDRLKEILPNV